MTGSRFEAARKELLKSLEQLGPYHSFYVMFFDRKTMHMMDDEKENKMLPANSENIQRVSYWIKSVKVGFGNTSPLDFHSVRFRFEARYDFSY